MLVFVAKDPVWDGAVINIVATALAIDERPDLSKSAMVGVCVAVSVGVEIIVVNVLCSADLMSDVLVGMLIDALAGVIISIVFSSGVDVFGEVYLNIFALVMTTLDFVTIAPSKFSCWAAFCCWFIAVLNCLRVLQAWMPSRHV